MADETIDRSVDKSGHDLFLITKASRAGGPVTVKLRSSFIFVAQGPYLTRYNNRKRRDDADVDVNVHVHVDDTNKQDHINDSWENPQQLLVFNEIGGHHRGGGTIHGIHFLENETKTLTTTAKNICTSWDAVVYGGNRLAFCNLLSGDCGGSTTDSQIVRQDVTLAAATTSGRKKSSLSSTSPFLELGDWIWNVKTFPNKTKTTLVVGYARHMLEVWNLEESITDIEDGHDECIDNNVKPTRRIVIISSCLRRLFLNPSTVVTSMDFIFVRQQEQHGVISTEGVHNENDTLWVAAGTSFHKIWVSYIPIDSIISPIIDEEKVTCDALIDTAESLTARSSSFTTKNSHSSQSNNVCNHRMDLTSSSNQNPKTYLLKGHIGVVHCVRWFNDGGVISLASTSDDRSVRKWVWEVAQQQWINKWVGWGHSARVWSVADLSISSPSSTSSLPTLVSVSEDGTARVWSTESGEILGCIHHPTTLWTVDTQSTMDGGMMLIGATDGISAIYNVNNHITGGNRFEVPIPDDRPPKNNDKPRSNGTINGITSIKHSVEENQITNTLQSIKKKKKKKKLQAQVILGMQCWWDGTSNRTPRVIVATRQGTLMSLNIDTQEWDILEPWLEKSIGERYGIHPSNGCCMAVHDTICAVAIGTTRGDIVLTSLEQPKDRISTVLNACGLRGVQGLRFIDSSCLVSFHIQSVALWNMELETVPNIVQVDPTIVLNVKTKGIPLSCAYDRVNHRVIVGDSRGNLLYFNTQNIDYLKCGSIEPTSTIHRVHQKQHVMSIKWLDTHTILSAGNDGCLHISYLNGDLFKKGWSYPAPFITGITAITQSSGPTIVAGYYGNTFRVMDIDSGCEYIRANTGGRQRRFDCRVDVGKKNLAGMPLRYQLAVCKGLEDGSNSVFVQHSSTQHVSKISTECCDGAKGVKLHGKTIFGSAFFTLTNQEIVFLVTASEDCSSRISAWKQGRIIDSVLLTPQESCCRCVAASKIDEKSVLLVVGGGKLSLQFFLVKGRSNFASINTTRDLEITFIGKGSTGKKGATIDHRVNAVNAIPLLDDEHRSHLVVAGDSDGCSHVFLINEDDDEGCKNIRGLHVPTMIERPILCIEVIAIANRILILMGTTGGDIAIFDVPASLSQLENSSLSWWNSIGSYHGHQMGANTIFAQIVSMEMINNRVNATVLIVTGGDDQALCISRVSLEQIDDCDSRLKLECDADINVIPEASFSAIKGVSLVSFRGKNYLFMVGYSQQLSVWRFHSKNDTSIQCISRVSVDLGDINCLSVYQPSNESTCVVAVCGMGVEMFLQVR